MKKGMKIRSYILHPTPRVVDHRTDLVIHDVRGVLDGDIDAFIEAALLDGVCTPRPGGTEGER